MRGFMGQRSQIYIKLPYTITEHKNGVNVKSKPKSLWLVYYSQWCFNHNIIFAATRLACALKKEFHGFGSIDIGKHEKMPKKIDMWQKNPPELPYFLRNKVEQINALISYNHEGGFLTTTGYMLAEVCFDGKPSNYDNNDGYAFLDFTQEKPKFCYVNNGYAVNTEALTTVEFIDWFNSCSTDDYQTKFGNTKLFSKNAYTGEELTHEGLYVLLTNYANIMNTNCDFIETSELPLSVFPQLKTFKKA
jgi:hypothetical protein